MARVYDVTGAVFPGQKMTVVPAVNYGVYPSYHTDSFTVPSQSPYKMVLDYRPRRGTLSVTLNGAAVALIEGSQPSSAGVVCVDYVTGALAFHGNDAGKAAVATYQHYGTVLDAGAWNRVQYEVAAVQGVLLGGVCRSVFIPGVPETTRTLGGLYVASQKKVARVNVFCANRLALSGSGSTTITVGGAETGSVTDGTNGVVASPLTQSSFATSKTSSWVFAGGWLYVRCSGNAGGHADITVEVCLE